jgi:hypothetical protein
VRAQEDVRAVMYRGWDGARREKGRSPVGPRPGFYVLADVRFLLHSDHPLPLVVAGHLEKDTPALEGHGGLGRGCALSEPVLLLDRLQVS